MILLFPPALIAQEPAPAGSEATAVLAAPEWLKRPSAAAIQNALPAAAAADGVGGQAGISCEIEADARLSHCTGGDLKNSYGFNAAALSLAPSFRIRPGTRDGEAIRRGRVYIPIRFEPPAGAALRVHPLLTRAPTASEVQAVLPRSAVAAGAGGRGLMRCTLSGGLLGDCRPAGDAADPFSRAAVKLSPKFAIANTLADGRPAEGVILDIPVAFDAPKTPQPSPAPQEPPRWLRAPTKAQLEAVFPQAAKVRGIASISVTQTCRVQVDGGLDDCQVTREDPVGVGGAEAARRLSNAYQTIAWTPEGRPTAGAKVDLDLVLTAPPAEPPAFATSPARVPAKRPAPRR